MINHNTSIINDLRLDKESVDELVFISSSPEASYQLGYLIGEATRAYKCSTFLLEGDLGAGKTQLTKGLAEAYSVAQDVTSPTFTIHQAYEGRVPFHHFDLYRLGEKDKIEDTGLLDVIGEDERVLVAEWPAPYLKYFDDDRFELKLKRLEELDQTGEPQREISIAATGAESQAALTEMAACFKTSLLNEQSEQQGASSSESQRRELQPGDALIVNPLTRKERCEGKLVLVLDTSNDQLIATLGVIDPTGAAHVVASDDHACFRHANEHLMVSIDKILQAAELEPQDLDYIVCGKGPGSFTGVRIGVASAKGLAQGLNKPLYGVSVLDAQAQSIAAQGTCGTILLAIDAKRKEVYPTLVSIDVKHNVRRLWSRDFVIKKTELAELIAKESLPVPEQLILAGNALISAREEMLGIPHAAELAPSEYTLTGEGLLQYFAQHFDEITTEQTGDPALVLPIYTRLSDAEETERKRLGLAETEADLKSGVNADLAGIHLQLRPMALLDITQVAKLGDEIFGEGGHVCWSKEMITESFENPDSIWWVAHDQGSIIGYVCGMRLADSFNIDNVAVAALRRHEGIAHALIERVAYDAHMLNCTKLTLEVEAGNAAARALYTKLGFVEDGVRPAYYSNGADAILMSAQLPLIATGAPDHQSPEPHASVHAYPLVAHVRNAAVADKIMVEKPLILSIESSCDETAMSVTTAEGKVIANVVATQIDFHARFGGVVPEIASRKHTEAICGVFEEVMAQAGAYFGTNTLTLDDIDAIGVTAGPGLVGALVVGVAFAKGLALSHHLPLIPVQHLEGHLMANLFADPELKPPFIASLVSGGNTMLVLVKAWGDYVLLGQTIDDAVGEAFDKVAKALGLGYPGGPIISKLAAKGNPKAIQFPRAMLHSHDFNFSLSGLKTSVITYINKHTNAGRELNVNDLAASFQAAVVDVQVAKAVEACKKYHVKAFCVGGGVAANPALREGYSKALEKIGVKVCAAPIKVCGDNAAMIGVCALRSYNAGTFADLSLDANPNVALDEWASTVLPISPQFA